MKIGAQLFTVREFCKTKEDLGETLKKIPTRETRNYVKKAERAQSYYKNTYYRKGVSVK